MCYAMFNSRLLPCVAYVMDWWVVYVVQDLFPIKIIRKLTRGYMDHIHPLLVGGICGPCPSYIQGTPFNVSLILNADSYSLIRSHCTA